MITLKYLKRDRQLRYPRSIYLNQKTGHFWVAGQDEDDRGVVARFPIFDSLAQSGLPDTMIPEIVPIVVAEDAGTSHGCQHLSEKGARNGSGVGQQIRVTGFGGRRRVWRRERAAAREGRGAARERKGIRRRGAGEKNREDQVQEQAPLTNREPGCWAGVWTKTGAVGGPPQG